MLQCGRAPRIISGIYEGTTGKLAVGPQLEEPFLFRFLALSKPADGAREGCTAEKVPVHRYSGGRCAGLSTKVHFRTVYVTFSLPCLAFPCLYARSSAQHGMPPGHFFPHFSLCQRCRWLYAKPRQEGSRAILFSYAGQLATSMGLDSDRLLGCQDSDLADLVNLQSLFFFSFMVQATGFRRGIMLSTVLSIP